MIAALLTAAVAVAATGAGWLAGARQSRRRAETAEGETRWWQEHYGELRVEVERLTVRTQQDIPSASGAHRHRLRHSTGSCIRPVRPGVQRAIREIEKGVGR